MKPTSKVLLQSCRHITLPSRHLLLFILIFVIVSGSPSDGLTSDGHALLAFRSTMLNPDARLQGWKGSDETPCGWFGITCGTGEDRVVAVDLSGVFLHGSIASELGQLTELRRLLLPGTNTSGEIPGEIASGAGKLEVLDLSLNELEGQIPPGLLGGSSRLEEAYLYSNNLGGPVMMAPPPSLRVLWIHDNNLTGSLPDIGGQCALESVRVGGNAGLSGPLPASLAYCRRLTFIGAAATGISGSIPASLGTLQNLTVLSLYHSAFTGPIPADLGNCSNLRSLFLHINHLSGSIPAQLGNLSLLTDLLLWGNSLEGPIPPQIALCSSLQTMDLSLNHLSGTIPPQIGALPSLQQLLLSVNSFHGEIPAELHGCASLTDLQLDNNHLSGPIPPSLGSLQNLQTLFLWGNRISGAIPASLGNCTSLEAMDFSYNLLTGEIPKEIFALQNLTKLLLVSNNLTGPLPAEVGNCKALTRLRLSINSLTGFLPKELGRLQSLVFLDLYENQFQGPIPVEMSNLTSMQGLDMHSNRLTGGIPAELASLRNLLQLDLHSNLLTGPIPPQIGGLKDLTKLDLSRNLLSGTIPGDHLRDCAKLTLLDLSNNRLSGTIPAGLGNITSLDIALNLSWNNLTGDIPSELGRLTQLQFLDLSHNQLTGSLQILTAMESLTSLNVSFNLFTGVLPTTPFFRTLLPSAVMGNPGLCIDDGDQTIQSSSSLPPSCSELLHSQRSITKPSAATISLIVCLLTACCAGLLFFGAILLLYRMRKASKELHLQEVDSPWPWSVTYFCKLNLTVQDVVDGLVEHNVVGKGCSGQVYKVEIPGGHFIAVKKLWPSVIKQDDELGHHNSNLALANHNAAAAAAAAAAAHHDPFSCEIETLGRIRHRNIVRLLGYCNNHTQKLLLYDYMPNGSLADLLFEKKAMVDWDMRYDILVGAAHGLAYLHHDCVPAILHRDVKCNNILLGSRFEPFLADFGLAKLIEGPGRSDDMSKVAGSYGYIAPEYGYTLNITEKSDVYSFGVVLLEVITGRRAVEPSTSDGLHIVEWVKMMKRSCKPTVEIVDPRLRGMPDPFIQEMEQTMGVALLCVNRIPPDRPTMKDVVALLLEVKHPLEDFGCNVNDHNSNVNNNVKATLPSQPLTPTFGCKATHTSLPPALHDPLPDQLQLHLLDHHELLHTDHSQSFLL